jgi:hypothetical protein
VVLGHQVDAKEILEAKKQHLCPTAGSSSATEVAEHFGALHQVEIEHRQPSSQETK